MNIWDNGDRWIWDAEMRKGRINQNKPFKQSRESENAVERSFGDIRKKLFVGLNKLSRTYERFFVDSNKVSRTFPSCCLLFGPSTVVCVVWSTEQAVTWLWSNNNNNNAMICGGGVRGWRQSGGFSSVPSSIWHAPQLTNSKIISRKATIPKRKGEHIKRPSQIKWGKFPRYAR